MTVVSTTAVRCSCNRTVAVDIVGLTGHRSAPGLVISSLKLMCMMGFNLVVAHLYCMANL